MMDKKTLGLMSIDETCKRLFSAFEAIHQSATEDVVTLLPEDLAALSETYDTVREILDRDWLVKGGFTIGVLQKIKKLHGMAEQVANIERSLEGMGVSSDDEDYRLVFTVPTISLEYIGRKRATYTGLVFNDEAVKEVAANADYDLTIIVCKSVVVAGDGARAPQMHDEEFIYPSVSSGRRWEVLESLYKGLVGGLGRQSRDCLSMMCCKHAQTVIAHPGLLVSFLRDRGSCIRQVKKRLSDIGKSYFGIPSDGNTWRLANDAHLSVTTYTGYKRVGQDKVLGEDFSVKHHWGVRGTDLSDVPWATVKKGKSNVTCGDLHFSAFYDYGQMSVVDSWVCYPSERFVIRPYLDVDPGGAVDDEVNLIIQMCRLSMYNSSEVETIPKHYLPLSHGDVDIGGKPLSSTGGKLCLEPLGTVVCRVQLQLDSVGMSTVKVDMANDKVAKVLWTTFYGKTAIPMITRCLWSGWADVDIKKLRREGRYGQVSGCTTRLCIYRGCILFAGICSDTELETEVDNPDGSRDVVPYSLELDDIVFSEQWVIPSDFERNVFSRVTSKVAGVDMPGFVTSTGTLVYGDDCKDVNATSPEDVTVSEVRLYLNERGLEAIGEELSSMEENEQSIRFFTGSSMTGLWVSELTMEAEGIYSKVYVEGAPQRSYAFMKVIVFPSGNDELGPDDQSNVAAASMCRTRERWLTFKKEGISARPILTCVRGPWSELCTSLASFGLPSSLDLMSDKRVSEILDKWVDRYPTLWHTPHKLTQAFVDLCGQMAPELFSVHLLSKSYAPLTVCGEHGNGALGTPRDCLLTYDWEVMADCDQLMFDAFVTRMKYEAVHTQNLEAMNWVNDLVDAMRTWYNDDPRRKKQSARAKGWPQFVSGFKRKLNGKLRLIPRAIKDMHPSIVAEFKGSGYSALALNRYIGKIQYAAEGILACAFGENDFFLSYPALRVPGLVMCGILGTLVCHKRQSCQESANLAKASSSFLAWFRSNAVFVDSEGRWVPVQNLSLLTPDAVEVKSGEHAIPIALSQIPVIHGQDTDTLLRDVLGDDYNSIAEVVGKDGLVGLYARSLMSSGINPSLQLKESQSLRQESHQHHGAGAPKRESEEEQGDKWEGVPESPSVSGDVVMVVGRRQVESIRAVAEPIGAEVKSSIPERGTMVPSASNSVRLSMMSGPANVVVDSSYDDDGDDDYDEDAYGPNPEGDLPGDPVEIVDVPVGHNGSSHSPEVQAFKDELEILAEDDDGLDNDGCPVPVSMASRQPISVLDDTSESEESEEESDLPASNSCDRAAPLGHGSKQSPQNQLFESKMFSWSKIVQPPSIVSQSRLPLCSPPSSDSVKSEAKAKKRARRKGVALLSIPSISVERVRYLYHGPRLVMASTNPSDIADQVSVMDDEGNRISRSGVMIVSKANTLYERCKLRPTALLQNCITDPTPVNTVMGTVKMSNVVMRGQDMRRVGDEPWVSEDSLAAVWCACQTLIRKLGLQSAIRRNEEELQLSAGVRFGAEHKAHMKCSHVECMSAFVPYDNPYRHCLGIRRISAISSFAVAMPQTDPLCSNAALLSGIKTLCALSSREPSYSLVVWLLALFNNAKKCPQWRTAVTCVFVWSTQQFCVGDHEFSYNSMFRAFGQGGKWKIPHNTQTKLTRYVAIKSADVDSTAYLAGEKWESIGNGVLQLSYGKYLQWYTPWSSTLPLVTEQPDTQARSLPKQIILPEAAPKEMDDDSTDDEICQ